MSAAIVAARWAMLFEAERHESLIDKSWDEAAARAAIAEIARDAESSFDAERWWPVHPLDAEDGIGPDAGGRGLPDLYFGGVGVIWGLDALQRAGFVERGRDYA